MERKNNLNENNMSNDLDDILNNNNNKKKMERKNNLNIISNDNDLINDNDGNNIEEDDNNNMVGSVWRSYSLYWIYGKLRSKIQPYIDDSFEATQIVKNLWVGGICSSSNMKNMKSHGIKMIVSAHVGACPLFPYEFQYRLVELLDIPNENIFVTFEKILPDIRKVIERDEAVLVHCIAGASRSVSIIAAYLMKYHNMTSSEALDHMKKLRDEVDPNEGYRKQLKSYELYLKNMGN